MENVILRLPFSGDWPVTLGFGTLPDDPTVQEKFRQWGIAGHHGLDFGLPSGTAILAADSGKVLHSGPMDDFGTAVTILHPWGQSLYAHLVESKVAIGQEVKSGEIIAVSGQSGAATGPHLHFGIKPVNFDPTNGFLGFIDPTPYLSPILAPETEPQTLPSEPSAQPVPEAPAQPPPAAVEELPVNQAEIEQQVADRLAQKLSQLRIRANEVRRKKKEARREAITRLAQTAPVKSDQLQQKFRISRQTATKDLAALVAAGRLTRTGRNSAARYTSIR